MVMVQEVEKEEETGDGMRFVCSFLQNEPPL